MVLDDYVSGAIIANGFKDAKIEFLDDDIILVPFNKSELNKLIYQLDKNIDLLKRSGDYPEEKDDKNLMSRLQKACYYADFVKCSVCNRIYYRYSKCINCCDKL